MCQPQKIYITTCQESCNLNVKVLYLIAYGHILTSAKSSFVANNYIAFSHVRRLCNIIANNLTKHVRHVRGL